MKLNHLSLTVTDVQGARRFLERYFGLRSMEGTKDDDTFIGMLDGRGFVLTLMEAAEVEYPDAFHVGFLEESEERVREVEQRLKDDGFEPTARRESGGGLDLYYLAPGGFTIQLGAGGG
jgi:lactoylglutathione lyase